MGQESGPHSLDINTATKEILGLQNEVSQLGRNDSEMPIFAQIIKDLQAGNITPEKALQIARETKEGKHEPGERAEKIP